MKRTLRQSAAAMSRRRRRFQVQRLGHAAGAERVHKRPCTESLSAARAARERPDADKAIWQCVGWQIGINKRHWLPAAGFFCCGGFSADDSLKLALVTLFCLAELITSPFRVKFGCCWAIFVQILHNSVGCHQIIEVGDPCNRFHSNLHYFHFGCMKILLANCKQIIKCYFLKDFWACCRLEVHPQGRIPDIWVQNKMSHLQSRWRLTFGSLKMLLQQKACI